MKVGLLCGREYSFPPAFIDRVNALGRDRGISAEMVKLTGTKMGEPPAYRVIVDRISHEVEVLPGIPEARGARRARTSSTTRSGGPPTTSSSTTRSRSKLGVAVPKTVVLPQKSYPADIDLTAESLHNLGYPIDWDGLLDYVGRPAILKPYSGGGWKHVYKVNDRQELLAAYDGTGPYCMTLQEFIDFDQYVRCFTFGQTDIVPVAYDPRERRYLVDHAYLSPELGARIVRDAQTLNTALGYEMNTIEFAVKDGVPYAIDFLNPAPDFERDRITPHYFEIVVEKMAALVIDRAVNGRAQQTWPRWADMVGPRGQRDGSHRDPVLCDGARRSDAARCVAQSRPQRGRRQCRAPAWPSACASSA